MSFRYPSSLLLVSLSRFSMRVRESTTHLPQRHCAALEACQSITSNRSFPESFISIGEHAHYLLTSVEESNTKSVDIKTLADE